MTASCPVNVRLEVCIASLDDAIAAARAGADRLELNAALALGGLTPSIGLLNAVAKAVTVPVIAMVRPRSGGFFYDENDFKVMLADAVLFLKHGAAGIAYGFLQADGTIDTHRCRAMMEVIGKRESVFHRAFDVTPDPAAALETLIDLGVTRVMTSGQKATAMEGAGLIAKLIEQARGRIEVLPAGGIRPHNVRELIVATGCNQVHASLRRARVDASVRGNARLRYSTEKNNPEDEYDGTDAAVVAAMCEQLRQSKAGES